MEGAPNLRSLEDTLRAAAVELAELAAMADHLEFSASAFGRKLDEAMIGRLQMADLLAQRLAGVALFLATVADAAPGGVSLDLGEALAGLTLADQAARLAGAELPAPSALEPPAASGELTLFGE
jgi:hypothetical protein